MVPKVAIQRVDSGSLANQVGMVLGGGKVGARDTADHPIDTRWGKE
jgi:hypothetical protein